MATYTAMTRQVYRAECFAIHATGCRAITGRERDRHDAIVIGEAPTMDGAMALCLDAEVRGLGYDESHVAVCPCTKGGK